VTDTKIDTGPDAWSLPQPDNLKDYVAATPPDAVKRRLTRAQVLEIRRQEQAGVPWWLDRTGYEATVRALSFADKSMISGIDARLQAEITAGFNSRGGSRNESGNTTFGDLLKGIANEERIANAFCVAGFIDPPLVLTEADLVGRPDAWVVTDLHIEERRKYSGFVLGMDPAESRRISSFLTSRVADS
jgi:hypothetical protein